MKKLNKRNVISFGLLSVLLVGLVFTLTGCGFFNQGPDANIQTNPSPNDNGVVEANVNETIEFDGGNSEDPDGEITSYSWDFGSNFTSNSPEGNKVQTGSYSVADTYTVTLTVEDDGGATGKDSVDVEVSESN